MTFPRLRAFARHPETPKHTLAAQFHAASLWRTDFAKNGTKNSKFSGSEFQDFNLGRPSARHFEHERYAVPMAWPSKLLEFAGALLRIKGVDSSAIKSLRLITIAEGGSEVNLILRLGARAGEAHPSHLICSCRTRLLESRHRLETLHAQARQLRSQAFDVQSRRLAHHRKIGMVSEQVFLCNSLVTKWSRSPFANRAYHYRLP